MKLRTRGYLFIGLPLAFQILITAGLFINIVTLEQRIEKEALARRGIGLASQISELAFDAVARIATLRYSDVDTSNRAVQKVLLNCEALLKELRQVPEKDPTLKEPIDEYANASQHMLEIIWDRLGSRQANDTDTLFRVWHEYDYDFDFLITFRNTTRAREILRSKLTAAIGTTSSAREQERLRVFLVTALAINVALAFALASLYSSATVNKLNLLLGNVKAFSKGYLDMKTVPGNDEISTLNEQFKEMALERLTAERERGAVLQAVSHDIRGPIGAINIGLEHLNLAHETMPTEDMKRRLKRLSAETRRLVDLCNTFLDLESIENDKLKLDLQDHNVLLLLENARECIEEFAASTGKEIELVCDPDLQLTCDQDRLMQILVNLLSNAVKFTPDNSTITLIGSRPDSGGITISVQDQGPGIPENEAKLLFEKFSQLDSTRGSGGSGLGLWICKRLAELHGAKITCASTVGKGTTFSIDFPA
ncbi:MAG: HAMP domain-containing histidine kinase [Candidatus Obscuribacterales bacterium]|nr:HAMP domain-containing histidine kinase [Candidatus Obscuribacterales bacterium]